MRSRCPRVAARPGSRASTRSLPATGVPGGCPLGQGGAELGYGGRRRRVHASRAARVRWCARAASAAENRSGRWALANPCRAVSYRWTATVGRDASSSRRRQSAAEANSSAVPMWICVGTDGSPWGAYSAIRTGGCQCARVGNRHDQRIHRALHDECGLGQGRSSPFDISERFSGVDLDEVGAGGLVHGVGQPVDVTIVEELGVRAGHCISCRNRPSQVGQELGRRRYDHTGRRYDRDRRAAMLTRVEWSEVTYRTDSDFNPIRSAVTVNTRKWSSWPRT